MKNQTQVYDYYKRRKIEVDKLEQDIPMTWTPEELISELRFLYSSLERIADSTKIHNCNSLKFIISNILISTTTTIDLIKDMRHAIARTRWQFNEWNKNK